MATVVVERLPAHEYLPGCASLPRDYGKPGWEKRPEVAAIRAAVFAALDRLESETGIAARLQGRRVLVKPNLVMVFDHLGTERAVSPETTDQRVLDAVVVWLSRRAARVDIVESSGRGSPTRAAFATAGLDRLARHRGCGLLALEEEPVDRYFLPKARVQREILIPRIFSEVVRGEAAYVSVPKLKTNLYTGVTLGFKNAMGVIPYNLRQRHHHYSIDRKLVEMLYLFKPDIVLIDGVVGGEGECPAPVDPVDSRLVIAGDHAVETDRVATRIMGFDPESIGLMRVAEELGFGSGSGARVLGDATPVPFRPADASLLSDRVHARFPGLSIFIGIDRAGDPPFDGDPALPRKLEKACWGGCAATTRLGLALIESEGRLGANGAEKAGALIIGPGLRREGEEQRYWLDREGKAWTEEEIFALEGGKLVVGSCGRRLAGRADFFVEGCMPLANAPHMALHALMGTSCSFLSGRNRHLLDIFGGMFAQRSIRRRLLKAGERLDVPFSAEAEPSLEASPPEVPGDLDWVPWPLPPVRKAELRALLAFEDDAAAASIRGIFQKRFAARLFWRSQALLALAVTWAPLLLAALAGAGLDLGLSASTWLFAWLAIEVLHAAELPFSLRAMRDFAGRGGKARPVWKTCALTLAQGYPSWLPWSLGLHD